jgi:hypothetical protein
MAGFESQTGGRRSDFHENFYKNATDLRLEA